MAEEVGADIVDVQERFVFQEGKAGSIHFIVQHVQRKVCLSAHHQHDTVFRQSGRDTQQTEDVQKDAPVHVHVDGVFFAGKVGSPLR